MNKFSDEVYLTKQQESNLPSKSQSSPLEKKIDLKKNKHPRYTSIKVESILPIQIKMEMENFREANNSKNHVDKIEDMIQSKQTFKETNGEQESETSYPNAMNILYDKIQTLESENEDLQNHNIMQLNEFRTKERAYLDQIDLSVQENQQQQKEVKKFQCFSKKLNYFQLIIDEKDEQINSLTYEFEMRTQQLEQIIQKQQEEIRQIKLELRNVKEQTFEFCQQRQTTNTSLGKENENEKEKLKINEFQLGQLMKEFKNSENNLKNITNSKYSFQPTERILNSSNTNQQPLSSIKKKLNSPEISQVFTDFSAIEQRKREKNIKTKVETRNDYLINQLKTSPKYRIPSFSEFNGSYTNQSIEIQLSKQETINKNLTIEQGPFQSFSKMKLLKKQETFLSELSEHESIIRMKINNFVENEPKNEILQNLSQHLELKQKQKTVQDGKIRKLK